MIIRAAQMQLTESDLAAISRQFGLSGLTSLDGFENAVYRADGPTPHVLRITHTSRRTTSQIKAEMTFLHALSDEGISVAAPIESRDGRLVMTHRAERSGMVSAVAMPFAAGQHRSPDLWSADDIRNYGRLLGRLHAVSADLARKPLLDRPNWDTMVMPTVDQDLAGHHPAIRESTETLIAELRAHPAGGVDQLVHEDAHLGNLFITDDGQITLFDFDDCGYGTTTYDLAMVVFYWAAGRPQAEMAARVRDFLPSFLAGYTSEYPLERGWAEGADLHMRLRELELYAALVDTDMTQDGWGKAFMDRRLERIGSGTPFLGRPLADIA